MKLTGNTILITGGTAGIGLGLAQRLSAMGNKVIVAGRRAALLDEITAAHPDIESMVLDVADATSIAAARATVEANFPAFNVLINNAGIMEKENLLEPSDVEVAERHIDTNLLGTVRMTFAFLPLLRGAENAALINVTSSLAFVPYPVTPTYSATKAALHSFTESLRIQLAAAGEDVQVTELIPPGVRTTLLGQQDDPNAMPLEEFLTETIGQLTAEPDVRELVVDRARFIRDAVADGTFESVLSAMRQA